MQSCAEAGQDGAFFHGDAIHSDGKRLAAELAAVDRDIEACSKELDTNDAAEAERTPGSDDGGGDRGHGSGVASVSGRPPGSAGEAGAI